MELSKTSTLSLNAAYSFGAANGLRQQVNDIRNMVIEWDSSYTSSLRRGYIIELFESSGIWEEFKKQFWPFGNTASGETKKRRYLRIKQQYLDFLAGADDSHEVEEADTEIEQEDQEFAAESDLRDFLAGNLSCIEPGLRFYKQESRSGVEFPIEKGFVDILAVDQQDRFVVIELKVGRGRNKTIGQLLYYMGWVDKNLGTEPCRGLIIAKEISADLSLAVERVPGVSLARYRLAVSVEKILPKASAATQGTLASDGGQKN